MGGGAAGAGGAELGRLEEWLRGPAGVQWDAGAVRLAAGPSGSGLHALRDLQEGEVVGRIPRASVLSVRHSVAREACEAAGLFPESHTTRSDLGLVVAILAEKSLGRGSRWAGYLEAIPAAAPIPFLWSRKQRARLLRGTELGPGLEAELEELAEAHRKVILPLAQRWPRLLAPDWRGFQQFLEACSLASSRGFYVDEELGESLVPLADMLNHKVALVRLDDADIAGEESEVEKEEEDVDEDEEEDEDGEEEEGGGAQGAISQLGSSRGANTRSRSRMSQDCAVCSLPDDPEDALCLVMRNPVAAGREVCNTYGELPNAALVHDYGFAVPGNPFDIVNLEGARAADIAISTFGASARRSLGKSGVEVPELFEIAATDRPEEPCRPQVPEGLLCLLAACDPDHRPTGSGPGGLAAVSPARGCRFLRRVLQDRLAQYSDGGKGEGESGGRSSRQEGAELRRLRRAGRGAAPDALAAALRAAEKAVLERLLAQVARRARSSGRAGRGRPRRTQREGPEAKQP